MFRIILKNLREKSGLSQYDLADILGVSQSTVGMWENGTNTPRLSTLKKIAEYFNVSINELTRNDIYKEDHQKTDNNNFNTEPKKLPQHESYFEIQDIIENIEKDKNKTYIVHGSEGKGAVIKTVLSEENNFLIIKGSTCELTKAEAQALQTVLEAMRSSNN